MLPEGTHASFDPDEEALKVVERGVDFDEMCELPQTAEGVDTISAIIRELPIIRGSSY